MDFVWAKPPTFKEFLFGGGCQILKLCLSESFFLLQGRLGSHCFLIEKPSGAMVQLLRNPAFLIVGGGGGPPPIKQELGLAANETLNVLLMKAVLLHQPGTLLNGAAETCPALPSSSCVWGFASESLSTRHALFHCRQPRLEIRSEGHSVLQNSCLGEAFG